jgi:hypothetical protein
MENCVNVGSTNADIAGLGIILAFTIQGFISLVLSVWSFVLRDVLERETENPRDERNMRRLKRYKVMRKKIDKVLATAADVQTQTGLSEDAQFSHEE